MTLTLIDKESAKLRGECFYFTGKPCRNGHVARRYVSSDRCELCKKAKDRRHKSANREALAEYSRNWYASNKEHGKSMRNAYYARMKTDPDFCAVRQAYKAKHRDRLLAIQRAKEATPEAKAAKAAKRKEQAHLYRGYEQKRRARLKGAIPKWYGELDDFAFEHAAELCDLRRRATGLAWEVDHMIPLLATRATGLHWHANIQVIPQRLNRQKNRRMILTQPREWIAHA